MHAVWTMQAYAWNTVVQATGDMADEGSKDAGKAKGGHARAKALSNQQRSAIARRAALMRHNSNLPRAIAEGVMPIGNLSLTCAVLDDASNTRILTQNAFLKAIGRHPFAAGGTGSASGKAAPFLSAKSLEPFISEDLRQAAAPILYLPRNPASGAGGIGYGYKGSLLPDVCWVYQDALVAGKLVPSQEHIGQAARAFLKSLTNKAIDDLIDEATGFADTKKMAAIYRMLEAYVSKEKLPYVKMFDIDFYKQIYRLNGWPFDPERSARPGVIGKWTNDIYDRVAPGFGQTIRARVKRNQLGRPTEKMTSYMTKDERKPRLREMIEAVKAVMRLSSDWRDFSNKLDIAYPKFDAVPLLPFDNLPRLERDK